MVVAAAGVVAVRGPLRRLDPLDDLLLVEALIVELPLLGVAKDLEACGLPGKPAIPDRIGSDRISDRQAPLSTRQSLATA